MLLRQQHESEGLAMLVRAGTLARRDGDVASELSTLHNQAAYLRSVKRDDEAAAQESTAATLARSRGILPEG